MTELDRCFFVFLRSSRRRRGGESRGSPESGSRVINRWRATRSFAGATVPSTQSTTRRFFQLGYIKPSPTDELPIEPLQLNFQLTEQ
jgi:hypothetical protein